MTTCTVHGAAFHRKLLKLHCAKSKQEGRRPPRLGGQTQKVIQSQQKMNYSGPKAAQRLREKKGKKELKKPGILVEDAFEACDRLQAAGFLQNPKRCPVRKGLLSDRFLFGKGERHVAVKCNSNECRRRFNVFYFSDKLPDKISRAMTPQQVLGAVTLYVQSGTKCTPSPWNAARVLGCGRKKPERLFKVFADKEAAAGRRLCNTMRLNSKVELDVTSLRVAKISTALQTPTSLKKLKPGNLAMWAKGCPSTSCFTYGLLVPVRGDCRSCALLSCLMCWWLQKRSHRWSRNKMRRLRDCSLASTLAPHATPMATGLGKLSPRMSRSRFW